MPWELLCGGDLFLISELEKHKEVQEAMKGYGVQELKGSAVCKRDVDSNFILCTVCGDWVHKGDEV